jgi:hypothetical protein
MRSKALIAATLLALLSAAPTRADDGSGGGQKAPEHKMTQADSYTMIEPFYTTIIDDDKPVGLLMIGVGIDVPDPKLRGEADHAMPVLRDAFIRNMMAFSVTSVKPDEQPDVTEIAARLQRVTDRVLGRKGARLLLAQVAMRISR